MKLGAVIVTHNRLKLLEECIQACEKQTYQFETVIIVNNNSTDGTKEYLNSLKYNNIEIINLENNLGGAGGFNFGIQHALKKNLDYLLLIDDDAIINRDYNKEIVIEIEKNDKGICGYSGTVKTQDTIQFEHRRYLGKDLRDINSTEEDYKKEYFDYELSSFCGLYLPIEIIKKIGLPREDFFIWFDDTEYSLKLKKYGRIRNINKACLNHKTTISKNNGHTWKSYYGLRNQIVIVKEYFPRYIFIKYIINMSIKIIGGKILKIIKNDTYYSEVSNMYRDALIDGLKDNMGKNEKYIPGFNINRKERIIK